ncbi:MAG TPA: 16S rRNA (cytidine(1402)-2'-O)-methyltransferase [Terriglobales bacterium]
MSHDVESTASDFASSPGRLYVVGTPIGNLEDVTLRAIRVLREVDAIACEDTRRTGQLLDHFGITTPMVSYHNHNELTRAAELIVRMEDGENFALVSDAGMPLISDPGHRLVKLAIRHNIPVIPVPGPSALITTLAAAGLPVDQFRFVGFLPSKRLARQRSLQRLRDEGALVFYEAPHRVVESLEDVLKILGDRPLVLARELTKLHEEFLRGPVSEVLIRLKRRPVKGEVTVLLGAPGEHHPSELQARSIQEELDQAMAEQGIDERAALKTIAKARGISKSEAYRQWQSEKGGPGI